MFQLRIGKDGRQIAPAKSATRPNVQSATTLTEGPLCNIETLPSIEHLPRQRTQRDDLPFTIRINPGNIANSTPKKDYDIKEDFVRKVVENLIDLKRNINAYRYLERDEARAKQHVNDWFHQAQNMFLASINGDLNSIEAQKIISEQLEMSKSRPSTPRQSIKQYHSLLPNFYQQQAQALRVEVETFRRNSIEEIKKLEEISSLFFALKAKYKAEKKANNTLNQAMEFYIDECDALLIKISTKYQKEKAVTVLEREMQQVLTKLKFKTFNYHYRP